MRAPRAGPFTSASLGALVGTVAVVAAAVIEVVFVLLRAGDLFVSSNERVRFAWTLASCAAALGAAVGALAGFVVYTARQVADVIGGGPRAAGRVTGTLALLPLSWTTILAVSGSGARRIPFRLAIAAAATLGGTTLVGFLAGRVAAWLPETTRRTRFATAAALVVAGIGLAIADRFVLVRLYEWFHVWLAVLEAMAFAAALLLFVGEGAASGGRGLWSAAGAIVLVVAFVLGAVGLRVVLRTENLRFLLAEEAPLGGKMLRLALRLGAHPDKDVAAFPEATQGGQATTGGLPVLDVGTTDVFLFTIDALRADHVGAYGHKRATTPALDAFARKSILFERAYTATPHTSYALTSLLTGKYVRSLARLGALLDDQETLADVLRRRGFRTAAFYPRSVFFIDRERFAALAERRLGFEYVKVGNEDARARSAQVLSYLDESGPGRPRFVWAHYFEPHEPYRPPEGGRRFGPEAVDLYDAEIALVDDALGPVLERLERDAPGAVVIVTSDHGEEFGEHGGRYHGTTVYEEQSRVPLIVHVPGLAARRVPDVVEHVDLCGTLLALLDVPASPKLRSDDLRPLLVGGRDPGARAFVETDTSLAVVDEGGKLVCHRAAEACRYFDLSIDPREQVGRPPAGRHAASLRAALSTWAASHARWEARAPREREARLPEALRRALLGDPAAAPEVVPLLRHSSTEVRRLSAEALGDLGFAQGREPLALALADSDEDVRELAALSLARLGDARGRDLLISILTREGTTEHDVRGRHRAALGLGALGEEAAVAPLVALVSDESVPLADRLEAVESLAKTRDRRAVPGLLSALPILRTRPQIVEALGRMGDRRAVPRLVQLLDEDRYAHHKAAAVHALGALGDPRAVPAVLRAATSPDPPPDVVWALLELGAVGRPSAPGVDLARGAPAGWRCDAEGCQPGASTLPLGGHPSPDPVRVLIRLRSDGDGGRVRLRWSGQDAGERPLVRGWQEVRFDLPSGASDAGSSGMLLQVDPPDGQVRVRAVVHFAMPRP